MKTHTYICLPLLLGACMAVPAISQAQDYGRPTTHTVCETVKVQNPPKDQHRIAGTAIGAVAGGLLGHTIGHGKGNTLATVGGAAAGGYAGNKIEQSRQESNPNYHYEKRCHQVN